MIVPNPDDLPPITHDWYPDGRADAGDGYVEIYNGVGGTIAISDYTLQIVGGDGITTTYTFDATLPAGRYYVLWAADMLFVSEFWILTVGGTTCCGRRTWA